MSTRRVPRDPNTNTRDRRHKDQVRAVVNSLMEIGTITRRAGANWKLTLVAADIPAEITRDTELTAAIAALSTVYQPLDSDLTAIAALATTTFGRALLTLVDSVALTAAVDDFTDLLSGLAPASGGGTDNFLRADGSWAEPPGTSVGIGDGDYGDVIVSGSGMSWVLDYGTIAFSDFSAADADVDFGGNEALSFCIENRTSDPGSPATGQIWLRTDL